jgi:hypothetical protein
MLFDEVDFIPYILFKNFLKCVLLNLLSGMLVLSIALDKSLLNEDFDDESYEKSF